ncbi:MAG: nucleotidyl transferase AbiEii/AbiGii toxin family protein [Clostridiales bacterium]|nr:nucleotidyl transferase AbiEii/AbiGii toxin family protein [Clostridiales bacterium]
MPTYDKAVLTEQARQLGFLTAPFEKMTRLTDILRFLNESDELRESLALKGGTAINLTVFNLPRLSVDIDLDFTENLTRDETRAKRDKISGLLERYMAAEGFTKHRQSKNTHILDSFVYSFINAAGNSDNIKVEINYSLRSHVLPTATMTARTAEVFVPFPVRILAPVEIFASKIVALSDRAAPRDLYDLNNMIYLGLFDEPDNILLRKCAVFYMAVAGDVSEQGFSFERIKDITPYKVRTDLFPKGITSLICCLRTERLSNA